MTSITEKAKQIRRSTEYKEWREKVLTRDNNSCVLCGSQENIEVDHIKPFALYPSLALEISNGRTLCHKCHKKTDTYGHLSKFKGDSPIHPLLSGDLFYKIKSLPSSIDIGNKQIGLSIKYDTNIAKWFSGYQVKKIKLMASSNTIDGSIDKLFDILRKASTYNMQYQVNLLNEKTMEQRSNKILRQGLYLYIESLLGRKLAGEERTEISRRFKNGIKNYFDNTCLND